MSFIFDIIDKGGRKVRLKRSTWTHIRIEHPNVESPEELIETLQKPDKIIDDKREEVEYFFKFYKHKQQKSKFLKVIVKYINNEGYLLSAHFVRHTS